MQMELGIVVLRVENWYRAVDWYRDVLGLTELYRDEAAQEAQFEAGPVHLAVEPATGPAAAVPGNGGGPGFVLQFRVESLDATVAELDADTKNAHSHRARSAALLRQMLHDVWHLA